MKRLATMTTAVVLLFGASAVGQDFGQREGCGKLDDAGFRSKVQATRIDCDKAFDIAKDFIREDDLRKGWRTANPAGCEFLMYRAKDSKRFRKWYRSAGEQAARFPLITFTKYRGCNS